MSDTDPRSSPNGEPPTDFSDADRSFAVDSTHRIRFTTGVFSPDNEVLRAVFEAAPDSPGRAVVFVDDAVNQAWPDLIGQIEAYADAHDDVLHVIGPPRTVPGGERAKNDWSAYQIVASAINDAGICRHSYVIAIGGGAMLDAVGFAASTAHRGVRLVRLPTTTLAQGDAGIGVKNGINAFGKKNFLGTFNVPWAVINDSAFLRTLSDRDWRAGMSEAVKVALLKDAAFFQWLVEVGPRLARRDTAAGLPAIHRSAELHLEHIAAGGDPFELLNARPLDFGHWTAHKLEQITAFQLRHGEAVAIGMAVDVLYSVATGLLDEREAGRILDCLTAIGFTLYDEALSPPTAVLDGIDEFREHLGGRLTITLLEGIGRPIDAHEIDRPRMVEAIERLRETVSGSRPLPSESTS